MARLIDLVPEVEVGWHRANFADVLGWIGTGKKDATQARPVRAVPDRLYGSIEQAGAGRGQGRSLGG